MGLRIEDVIERELYVDRHGASHPNKKDGRSIYFLNRVEDLFLDFARKYVGIDEEQAKDFIDSYYPINDLLVGYPRMMYKDSNLKNILYNSKGCAVAIDFEKLTLMPPQMELVKLFEYGKSEYLSETEIERLVEYYMKLDETAKGHTIDRQNFIDTYHAAGTHNHLCLAGYITSYFHIENVDRSEFFAHLERSRKHLEKLASNEGGILDISRMKNLVFVIDRFREKDVAELSFVNY